MSQRASGLILRRDACLTCPNRRSAGTAELVRGVDGIAARSAERGQPGHVLHPIPASGLCRNSRSLDVGPAGRWCRYVGRRGAGRARARPSTRPTSPRPPANSPTRTTDSLERPIALLMTHAIIGAVRSWARAMWPTLGDQHAHGVLPLAVGNGPPGRAPPSPGHSPSAASRPGCSGHPPAGAAPEIAAMWGGRGRLRRTPGAPSRCLRRPVSGRRDDEGLERRDMAPPEQRSPSARPRFKVTRDIQDRVAALETAGLPGFVGAVGALLDQALPAPISSGTGWRPATAPPAVTMGS